MSHVILTRNVFSFVYEKTLSPRLLSPFGGKYFSLHTKRRITMETVHTSERLKKLRELMKEQKVDIYG